ncbi:MAG: ABC transporter ATP-binding protein [Acidimicrobiales bacterium]
MRTVDTQTVVPLPEGNDARTAKLQLRGVRKSFGLLEAVRGVDFDSYAGEVHSILGENGAGKSTLMKVVAGIFAPDSGVMRIDGEQYRPSSPKQAMRHGVGMVHQDYQLVERFSVAENLFIGWDGARRISGTRSLAAQAAAMIERYGFKLDPKVSVRDLSVGEQQRVAILRALIRGASILILDEPTATLTPQEVEVLFRVMRNLANDGRAVLFITHKLREVVEVSTRVTVLRSGERVASLAAGEFDERLLAREMLGRDIDVVLKARSSSCSSHEAILRAECLRVRDRRGSVVLNDVSFEVRMHEIVGVAGVAGNGQRELSEAVTGVRPVESGSIYLRGEELTGKSAVAFVRAGVGFIPEDRLTTGMILRESIANNAIMKALDVDADRKRLTRGAWLRRGEVDRFAKEVLAAGQVSTRDPKVKVGNLSGGNIQRFLIARELRAARDFLVAVHPTSGLDVGAAERVWRVLLSARDEGIGVLLISEDLDEVLGLSDRIIVLFAGRIVGEIDNTRKPPSREYLGMLMGGSRQQVVAEPTVARVEA